MDEESGVFGVSARDIDSLPPEQREKARRALAEYEAMEPIAEVTVRVFQLVEGGSEVRFKTQVPTGTPRLEWYEKVARIVSDEVLSAREIFAEPGHHS